MKKMDSTREQQKALDSMWTCFRFARNRVLGPRAKFAYGIGFLIGVLTVGINKFFGFSLNFAEAVAGGLAATAGLLTFFISQKPKTHWEVLHQLLADYTPIDTHAYQRFLAASMRDQSIEKDFEKWFRHEWGALQDQIADPSCIENSPFWNKPTTPPESH